MSRWVIVYMSERFLMFLIDPLSLSPSPSPLSLFDIISEYNTITIGSLSILERSRYREWHVILGHQYILQIIIRSIIVLVRVYKLMNRSLYLFVSFFKGFFKLFYIEYDFNIDLYLRSVQIIWKHVGRRLDFYRIFRRNRIFLRTRKKMSIYFQLIYCLIAYYDENVSYLL